MNKYKAEVASHFVGQDVHFRSDCIIKLDVTGHVVGWEQAGSEIVYLIDTGSGIIKVGENTNKLEVEILSQK